MANEKYPVLYGYSGNRCVELHGVNEVAKFICTEGLENDLTITTPLDTLLLNTFGTFINQITDMEYREELMEVLVPMQMNMESEIFEDNSQTEKKEFEINTNKTTVNEKENEVLMRM